MGILRNIRNFLKSKDYLYSELDKQSNDIDKLKTEIKNITNTYYNNLGKQRCVSCTDVEILRKQIENNRYACEIKAAHFVPSEADILNGGKFVDIDQLIESKKQRVNLSIEP